ncbi:MAG: putative pyrroline-5-carboxylate reductase, partial [Pseudonocardiales bacterium]|nr:putative pyrroline-5-carboxylate reductase [Pseudonocardiales bacterium]
MTTLAIIGAGKLGGAVLAGVARSGWPLTELCIVEADPTRGAQLAQEYGVPVLSDIATAVTLADALLIAVKPADTAAVADEVRAAVTPGSLPPLVISAAAGIATAAYEARLPTGSAVVRVMPNTPAFVGEGMSAVSPGAHATRAHIDIARRIFGAVGQVIEVPEDQQDAVTAISGSGPAYVFLAAEALIAAAIDLGLSPEHARTLVVQTVVGAGVMLRDSGDDAATLRAAVTSPGGTTAAALAAFEA